MITDVKQSAVEKINEILASYNKELTDVQRKIQEVDEKFRKLAEAEKADLTKTETSLMAEMSFWTATLSRYDAAPVFTTTVTEDAEAPVEEEKEAEEESVVDNLFPENNEEPVEEESEDAPVEEESEEFSEEEPVEESAEEVDWNAAPAEPVDGAEKELPPLATDIDWPDTVEEWK